MSEPQKSSSEHSAERNASGESFFPANDAAVTNEVQGMHAEITNLVGDAFSSPEDSEKREAREVWSKFEHFGVKAETALLSESERNVVEDCVSDLVKSMRENPSLYFTAQTKENGPRRNFNGVDEHHRIAVQCLNMKDSHSIYDALNDLSRKIAVCIGKEDRDLLAAASDVHADFGPRSVWGVKIFPDPDNKPVAHVFLSCKVPFGNSYGDARTPERVHTSRSVGFSSNISLPQNSRIFTLLKEHPEHARLLPCIIRNAAMILNEQVGVLYYDVPFGAPEGCLGMKGVRNIVIADLRDRTISTTTDERKATSRTQKYTDSQAFSAECQKQQISVPIGFSRKKTVITRPKSFLRKELTEEVTESIPKSEWTESTFKSVRIMGMH